MTAAKVLNRKAAERAKQFREIKAQSGSKSFVLISDAQKAPYSNSNKQVHVKKVNVDSFDHVATTGVNKPQAKHSVSNEAKIVSETKLALPQIKDLEASSAGDTTGASSHRLLKPNASFQKQAASTSRGKFMTNFFDSDDDDDDSPTSYRSQCKSLFAEKVR